MTQIATFLNPACSVPLFQQSTMSNVLTCARINGFIGAFIFTLLLLIPIFFLVKTFKQKNHESTETYHKRRRWNIIWLSILGIIILLLWIFLPMINSWMNSKRWEGFQEQINSLVNNGYTRSQALDKIQSLYENKQKISAIQENGFGNVLGAFDIANAIRNTKN